MKLFDRLATVFKDLSTFRSNSRSPFRKDLSSFRSKSSSPVRTRSPSQDLIKSKPQPSSLEHSPFKKLHIEIINTIAEFLPLSAAVSFTLTCRPVWFILGSRYLDQLRTSDKLNKLVFLDLLQRDLPRHILCHDCEKLHTRAQRLFTPPGGELLPCTTTLFMSSVHYYIQYWFDSVTFLLAMKLHRYGLDCSEQLTLLSGPYSISLTDHICHQESTSRIVNGHFLLRHQTWLLFPVGRKVISPDIVFSCVCPHWDFRAAYKTKLSRQLHCRASHWDDAQLNSRCPTCSGLFQCNVCPTEFRIDAKDFFEHGVALILTRWLDLGEGRTLLDQRYASHVNGYVGDPVSFEAGSIRDACEGGELTTEKLLTPKHKADLFMRELLPIY